MCPKCRLHKLSTLTHSRAHTFAPNEDATVTNNPFIYYHNIKIAHGIRKMRLQGESFRQLSMSKSTIDLFE